MNAERKLRVFIYAQHLSGVGHYVRSLEIARALRARGHEVWITDGGMPVPHPEVAGLVSLELPRVARVNGKLVVLDQVIQYEDVTKIRKVLLRSAMAKLKPDRVLIEHYPFSKWELSPEINEFISAACTANYRVKVICSVRDIPRQTSHEKCSPSVYRQEVLKRLHLMFDALMVHGDENLCRLDDHFSGTAEIRLPWIYTGIVAEKLTETTDDKPILRKVQDRPYLLVSAGGGKDHIGLHTLCISAWKILQKQGELVNWRLILCAGLADRKLSEALKKCSMTDSIILRPFSADFLTLLQQAELAVVCSGYNTCANLLETRCRALLVPNPAMSDQLCRAQLMDTLGLAHVVDPAYLRAKRLANIILRELNTPKPTHDIPLDGAQRAAQFIEELSS
ncbi:MAG: glycosyltransferase family protein [Gammaproteobacteria bacterium]